MATKIAQGEHSMEGARPDRGSIPVEIQDRRVIRQAAQRNAAEKLAHREQQRHLDTQKRVTQAHLAREEKDLREQLRRLQSEQRALSEHEQYDYHSEVCSAVDEDESRAVSPEFVNPYPIVFPNSGKSTPRHSTHENHRVRHLDLHDHMGYHQYEPMLPPLRVSSRSSMGQFSNQCTPSVSISSMQSLPVGIRRSESLRSVLSTSPSDHMCWAGDPEAISSVRRPRKSVAEQKAEHKWSRSQSLKERPAARKDSSGTRKPVSRSKSMRECPKRAQRYSLCSTESRESSPSVYRSDISYPDSLEASVESLTADITELDLISANTTDAESLSRPILDSSGKVAYRERKTSVWSVVPGRIYSGIHHVPIIDSSKEKGKKRLACAPLKVNIPTPEMTLEKVTSPLPPIASSGTCLGNGSLCENQQ